MFHSILMEQFDWSKVLFTVCSMEWVKTNLNEIGTIHSYFVFKMAPNRLLP